MLATAILALPLAAEAFSFAPLPLHVATRRTAHICMGEDGPGEGGWAPSGGESGYGGGTGPSAFEDYIRNRNAGAYDQGTYEEAAADMKEFEKYDIDFDGGDSGSGAVGDGNVDLEDQHNSPTVIRGAGRAADRVAGGAGAGAEVGRGRIASATSSRDQKAKNYFGRSTGYADEILEERRWKEVVKRNNGEDRPILRQQLENWQNQKALEEMNRGMGNAGLMGQTNEGMYGAGGGAGGARNVYIARDEIGSDKWRKGAVSGEISQRDLAEHLKDLSAKPAERLDGEAWGALQASEGERASPEAVFEVKTAARGTSVTDIAVRNDLNTFAPFRAGFTADSSGAFSVSPDAGTMNRRSGEPIPLVVRFSPTDYGAAQTATLVFETEDMKKVWTFIGSTG